MGSGETPTQRTGDEEVKINLVQSAEEDICLQIWMLFGQQDVDAKLFFPESHWNSTTVVYN